MGTPWPSRPEQGFHRPSGPGVRCIGGQCLRQPACAANEARHCAAQWAIVEDRGCLPRSVALSPVIKEAAKPDVQRRLRAVLFVDVVDSVRLIRSDEAGTVGRWRAFANDVQTEDLPRFGGRRVKLTGDGMLLEFESTVSAVECAIAIQQRLPRASGRSRTAVAFACAWACTCRTSSPTSSTFTETA